MFFKKSLSGIRYLLVNLLHGLAVGELDDVQALDRTIDALTSSIVAGHLLHDAIVRILCVLDARVVEVKLMEICGPTPMTSP